MWLYLHRHNEPERSGFEGVTPVLIDTSSGTSIAPRMVNGKSSGCWVKTRSDDTRGGLWVEECFHDLCDVLSVIMPPEDWNKWRT